jgi:hypothetical protein
MIKKETVNIIAAIDKSIICHDFGLFKIGDINLAPYPREKKNKKDANAAPTPNATFS